jgi:hypothetical protein
MELTELQQQKLKEEINSFKMFNKDRMKIWELKPIIGAMRLSRGGGFVGFGVRFYNDMFTEPENLGSLTFYPIQIIS